MSGSFAREQSVYPFVHATVNLAFYMCTRNILWSIIAFYVWETIEKTLSQHISALAEDCTDSLIGDPIIGIGAIFAFFVLDFITGFDVVFKRHVHPVLRLFVFAGIGLTSFIAPQFESTSAYWGIAVFAAIYCAIVLAGFAGVVFYTGYNNEIRYARLSIVVWLLAVIIYAIISLVVLNGPVFTSSWMRVFLTELTFIFAALLGLLSK